MSSIVALLVILAGVGAMFSDAHAQAPRSGIFPASLSDFQQRALLIMDEKVVEDPNLTTNSCDKTTVALKPWSFGTMMRGLAGGDEAAGVELTKHWLSQFQTSQAINDDPVAPRDIRAIWDPWKNAGFDLKRVPFRLLAIVNRIDLFRSPLLSGENAGEVRFVFGAVDISDQGQCMPLRFTVILEFGVRRAGCAELQQWAQNWVDLATLPPTDPAFRKALAALITDTTIPKSARAKPNGSAIDHLRTNEALTTGDWQLREFRLDAKSGRLVQDALAMTPREELNGQAELTTYLKTITAELAAQDYWIPRRFPTQPHAALLGAAATAGTTWHHPNAFAKNTCSGCHGAEPDTALTHIDPETRMISTFLEMDELPVRESTLKDLAKNGCAVSLSTPSRRLVH